MHNSVLCSELVSVELMNDHKRFQSFLSVCLRIFYVNVFGWSTGVSLILFCLPPSIYPSVVIQGNLKRSGANSQASISKEYLLKALVSFQAACRLTLPSHMFRELNGSLFTPVRWGKKNNLFLKESLLLLYYYYCIVVLWQLQYVIFLFQAHQHTSTVEM